MVVFLVLLTSLAHAYIEDNSFLLDEAYNQDIDMYQTILRHQNQLVSDETESTFEFEVPMTAEHQLSIEIPLFKEHRSFETKPGDTLLLWQIVTSNNVKSRSVDRLGFVVPTGDVDQETGYGVPGVQYLKALSIELGRNWQNHWNFQYQLQPNGKAGGTEVTQNVHIGTLGSSVAYYINDHCDFLFETMYKHRKRPRFGGKIRSLNELYLNPGFRFEKRLEWNQTKMVPGISLPIEVLNERTDFGFMLYLSFEPHFE